MPGLGLKAPQSPIGALEEAVGIPRRGNHPAGLGAVHAAHRAAHARQHRSAGDIGAHGEKLPVGPTGRMLIGVIARASA